MNSQFIKNEPFNISGMARDKASKFFTDDLCDYLGWMELVLFGSGLGRNTKEETTAGIFY